MSTRSSIFYSEEKDKDYHIYIEMLDDTICIELHRGGMTVTAEIMTLNEWRSLGLPTSSKKPRETRKAGLPEIERLTAELKPCPFCGCTDIKMDFGPLHCRDCRKEYVNAATVDVLRERWNTRPIEDAQAAEIERLTAENATLRAENARLADEVRRLEYYFPEAN